MNPVTRSPVPSDTQTSATLLLRLRDLEDHEAWTTFVSRYAPVVFSWCVRFRLQESDAADVTQDVLVKLMRHMDRFDYEPGKGRFRGWLKTVTANTVRDAARAWDRRLRARGDTEHQHALDRLQAPDAVDELTDEMESQHQRDLLAAACENVRPRVRPGTWQAWKLTSIDQAPAASAAATLSVSIGTIYVARSRINKMLAEEVTRLQRALEDRE